jgi:hypothetical protein
MGRPPRSYIRERMLNVNSFGALAFPKNSTQKAGSNEKEENDGVCSIEAPIGVGGMVSWYVEGGSFCGKATTEQIPKRARILEIHDEVHLNPGEAIGKGFSVKSWCLKPLNSLAMNGQCEKVLLRVFVK